MMITATAAIIIISIIIAELPRSEYAKDNNDEQYPVFCYRHCCRFQRRHFTSARHQALFGKKRLHKTAASRLVVIVSSKGPAA